MLMTTTIRQLSKHSTAIFEAAERGLRKLNGFDSVDLVIRNDHSINDTTINKYQVLNRLMIRKLNRN